MPTWVTRALRPLRLRTATLATIVALSSLGAAGAWAPVSLRAQAPAELRGGPASAWVTAWGTSQQTLGEATVTNATVRLIARVTVPGDGVRIRLDNSYGTEPVRIGRAFVGLRVQGATVAAGSNRAVSFNGATDVVLPPGGTVWSDPVSMTVLIQQDLAVSLYVPGSAVRPSQHTNAYVTGFRTADGSGDAADRDGRDPFTASMTSMWWLKAVDVRSTASPGTIVMFGDSITDGTCSTLDAHDRWENVLSVRLALNATRRGGTPRLKAVVNEGIGGNTVTREGLSPPPESTPGLERLERDVLSHHRVTDVVVFMGTNDVRRGASAAQVTAGLQSIVRRLRDARLRVIGVTMIPRHNVLPAGTNTGWNPDKTRVRHEVNHWIRAKGSFDAVIDFDTIVRDPASPDLILPAFNCADGIHPSPRGYYEMGTSVPLDLFSGP